MSTQLLLGYIGAWNTFLFLPLAVAAIVYNPSIVYHLTWTIAAMLCVNGVLDNVVSDYFWARAVLMTSPTVATLGLSFTIPVALLSDLLLHETVPQPLAVVGAMMVICGFWILNSFAAASTPSTASAS